MDGTLVEGNGVMNEAFSRGEPFEIGKAPDSAVISSDQNAPATARPPTIRNMKRPARSKPTALGVEVAKAAELVHYQHKEEKLGASKPS